MGKKNISDGNRPLRSICPMIGFTPLVRLVNRVQLTRGNRVACSEKYGAKCWVTSGSSPEEKRKTKSIKR